uniref:Uncharacterized protein n=1 Tax=Setaria italica TaxID=4555 RepID=K4A4C6_SETIT
MQEVNYSTTLIRIKRWLRWNMEYCVLLKAQWLCF